MTGVIDIGGTKLAAGILGVDGRIIGRQESPSAPERGFADAAARMCAMLRKASQIAGGAITGVGIASAGPVDPLTGLVGNVGTLPGWEGHNLKAPFEAEFDVPVTVENDAAAAALAEAHWGSGRGARSFIYVTISTGIGGAVVIDGKLHRTGRGAHPEIGHQVIEASVDGPACYCGARGCWESLASGTAMAKWMNVEDAATVCARAIGGDALAQGAVDREALYLGLGLANLVTLFGPNAIALGGGVTKSWHLFAPRVLDVIRRCCTFYPMDDPRVTLASIGGDVVLAGAGLVWQQANSDDYGDNSI